MSEILNWEKTEDQSLGFSIDKFPALQNFKIKWREHEFLMCIDAANNYVRQDTTCHVYFSKRADIKRIARNKTVVVNSGNIPELKSEGYSLYIKVERGYITLIEHDENHEISNIIPVVEINNSEPFPPHPPKKEWIYPRVSTNCVTLYENHGANYVSSFASISGENLIVDYGIIGKTYEDEYFITVSKDNLNLLYREFNIADENKHALLIGIYNAFQGKKSFDKFKAYLKQEEIPFTLTCLR